VTLNRAVAVGHVISPQAGLDLLATLDTDPRMRDHHRLLATRAHLLEQSGDRTAAAAAFRAAAARATSLPERRHLLTRATHLE
jgi:predicted RNA polymerase sigma factor